MRHGRKGCGRTDKGKLRGASRRQHKRERRGVCVSVLGCVYPCVYPSCARWLLAKSLVAKGFSQHRHRASRSRPQKRETKPHGHHFAGVQRTDYVLLPLSRPPGMPRERGCCEAQRPGRAAGRLRAAAARQAARDAERARRESEAAVKRSDLAYFDPDTPLEKLRWAREEMKRNLQQPMSARTMRVCTVCSERWDTAEDGGGDYRRVVCCPTGSRNHTNVPPVDAHV